MDVLSNKCDQVYKYLSFPSHAIFKRTLELEIKHLINKSVNTNGDVSFL